MRDPYEVEALIGFEAETPRMQRSIVLPRVIFAGASSDVGKTSIALGVAGALRASGSTVVAAKCGPDFIDTAHLGAVTGRTARNLDAWISGEASVATSLARSAREAAADIAIVEGVMGLFDGRHGSGDGSSAHVARLLGAPVVLVLDCAKAATTIGAIAYGLKHFDARINVAGAILNRVASDRHAATVRDAVASAGVPVLGVIKRDERLTLPGRHLGLVGPEGPDIAATYAALAETMRRDVDLDALLAIASATEPLHYAMPGVLQSRGAHAYAWESRAMKRSGSTTKRASMRYAMPAPTSCPSHPCETRYPTSMRSSSVEDTPSCMPPRSRPIVRCERRYATRSRRECRSTRNAAV
jgi:cobyrinic acid a,c-diamide synthase